MTRTEIKQLRKAKLNAEMYKRSKTNKKPYVVSRATKAGRLTRLSERLHFLIIEGRQAFWFRKRGLPRPTSSNVREDIAEIHALNPRQKLPS